MISHEQGVFAIAIISFVLYYYLTFVLVGTILEKPKLNRFGRVTLSLFNAILMTPMIILPSSMTIIFYCLLFVLFFVEFYLLHHDSILRIIFVVLACMIHVMAIRSICVGIFALCLSTPFHLVVATGNQLLYSSIATALALDIAIILVLKFIPAIKVKIINQHNEQLKFMTNWLGIFNLYLIINSGVYSLHATYPFLNTMQIVTPIAILAGVYVVLFFSIKTNELLGYKEKTSELEVEIHREQQYRNSIFKDTIATYEFNLTKDVMTSEIETYRELLGNREHYSYSDILFIMSEKMLHPDDRLAYINSSNVAAALQTFASGTTKTVMEYRRLTPNGNYIWVKSVTNLVKDFETGDITGFTYVRNINDEKEIQLDLRYKAERDQLTGLYNKFMTANLISEYLHSTDALQRTGALFIIDIDNFKTVNDNLGHIFGDSTLCDLSQKLTKLFSDDDIVGRIGGDEFMIFMKDAHKKKEIEAKANEICEIFCNTYWSNNCGAEYSISASVGISVFPIHGNTFEKLNKEADTALYTSKSKGKNIYTIYEGEDFTEYQSGKIGVDDLVAGVGFGTFKLLAADILFKNLDQNQAIIRTDINDFRVINGMHGFAEGDEILKNMANAIEQTIAPNGIFSRMSNDNFIILVEYQEEKDIYALGEKFAENFQQLNHMSEKNYSVDFTSGFVKVEKNEKDIVQLIEKATMAHRAAKKTDGTNMICYVDTLRDNAVKLKSMENAMHAALANNKFIVYLQPKYNLRSEVMVGAEALIRWVDSTDTIIQPNDFIPLFEKNGFIVKIDLFVLEQVCRLQRDWLDRGIAPVVISVNQSKRLVSMPDYVKTITAIVRKYDLDPHLIELEMTETIIHDNLIKLQETLESLKELGFIISIDDFGSGYSSLGMLKEIHADVLKIDREFLKRSERNERGEIVLHNVIRLAKELKMSVVAEGVETPNQAKLLSSLSCDSAQGFLFARPMPTLDFEKRLLECQEDRTGTE